MTSPKPKVISLFSGAGGLDLGVEAAGAKIVVCIEPDEHCVATLKANTKGHGWKILDKPIQNYKTGEILRAAKLDVGEAALVIGGPPCQPFSKSGFWVEGRKGIHDERNLLGEFVRVVKEARPLGFIMENVFGLFYKTSKIAFDQLYEELTDEGYTIEFKVVNAADYGVPQIRERLFILGSRVNSKLRFPEGHYRSPNFLVNYQSRNGSHGTSNRIGPEAMQLFEVRSFGYKPWVTAGDVIGRLASRFDRDKALVYAGRWKKQLAEIPAGRNYLYFTAHEGHPTPLWEWRSRYWSFLLKLAPDKPSWTIQAQPGPAVGPFHWNSRYLSQLEMKRIQTFPDQYKILGPKREVQRQIGNAVPPKLSEAIASDLLEQIAVELRGEDHTSGTNNETAPTGQARSLRLRRLATTA
jgi:DNA (cytosine-5)-methyltransferase 1